MKEDIKENDKIDRIEVIVDPGQSPIRIDKFLFERIDRITRSRIQAAIKHGAVLVNKNNIKSNYKVRPNDIITLELPRKPAGERTVTPQDIPLNIIYEDDDLLVLNKEAGMVVHPGVSNPDGTLVNALVYYLNKNTLPVMDGNGIDRPGLVHRIDKDTSGLLVIAKTNVAMSHLAKQFFDHSIERSYTALVWGNFNEESGTIENEIGRHPTNRIMRAVIDPGEGGKHAITHYKVIEDLYYVSLINCKLETGRTHQIRVHMKHEGHPIFSDSMYGGDKILKGTIFTKYKQFVQNCFKIMDRQALHAQTLSFIHPTSNERMSFDSELPEDFSAVLDKWRGYLSSRKNVN